MDGAPGSNACVHRAEGFTESDEFWGLGVLRVVGLQQNKWLFDISADPRRTTAINGLMQIQ
jgi:hypothetical protein